MNLPRSPVYSRPARRGFAAACLWLSFVLLSAALSACVSSPPPAFDRDAEVKPDHAPLQLFDENSGATVFTVDQPIVMARGRSDVAANVRDYVTLAAMQEDRGGNWLIAHRWSTVDPRIDPAHCDVAGTLILVADGRSIVLIPVSQPPKFFNRKDWLFLPERSATSWAYAVDVPTLRFLAGTQYLSLRFPDDRFPVTYSIWADGRKDLQGLLDKGVNVRTGKR